MSAHPEKLAPVDVVPPLKVDKEGFDCFCASDLVMVVAGSPIAACGPVCAMCSMRIALNCVERDIPAVVQRPHVVIDDAQQLVSPDEFTHSSLQFGCGALKVTKQATQSKTWLAVHQSAWRRSLSNH